MENPSWKIWAGPLAGEFDGASAGYNTVMRSRFTIVAVSVFFALLTLLPYALAYASAGGGRFMGFFFNPYDGASYLAKMRQGWEGAWQYSLAFTIDPGPGAYLFLYYLALGHIARLFGAPLIAVWQAARLAGVVAFLVTLWAFFGRLGMAPRARKIAWLTAVFGSGLGFTAVFFGATPADLWVAEYIPFLGMFTNAHFPIATALLLLIAMRIALPPRRQTPLSLAGLFLAGGALGILQPFALIPLGFTLAVWIAARRLASGALPEGAVAGLAAAGLGVLPCALYDLWAAGSSPQWASWFAQNQTPTPPVWDLALSLGLPGILAAIGLVRWLAARGTAAKFRAARPETVLLGCWLAINLALLFAPFSLQRRLMLGMWIPLAALAAPTIAGWICRPAISVPRVLVSTALLLPSNLIFLLAVLSVIGQRSPLLFLSHEEAQAVDWLAIHGRGTNVLAAPDLGLWLPGAAGVRVLYGHPMETPNADAAKTEVEDFYAGRNPGDIEQTMNYIFYGPREEAFGGSLTGYPLDKAAEFGLVTIYEWRNYLANP